MAKDADATVPVRKEAVAALSALEADVAKDADVALKTFKLAVASTNIIESIQFVFKPLTEFGVIEPTLLST